MARKTGDATLDSKSARAKLKPRGKPYYRAIEPELHLGYRRLDGAAGKWVARRYLGGSYEVERLGVADDIVAADGVTVLDYWQAQNAARRLARPDVAVTKSGPITVDDVMESYFQFLESEGRSDAAIEDARGRHRVFIKPKLGHIAAEALTDAVLRKWRDDVAKAPARLRTKPGQKQRYRDEPDRRARRSTTNRIWTTLRAALNHGFNTSKIASDSAWRKVRPFRSVDVARVRYLTIAEAQRLINATDPAFRPLVQAALLTGGRYGQLAALVVGDFNPDAGTLMMRTRKGDGNVKSYHVHLTTEGIAFFKGACAGRSRGMDLIFRRPDGGVWLKSHQARPIAEASKHAGIEPEVSFHILRHTWASLAVMAGVPLLVVAGNLGHADTRMVERHYGHLAPSYRQDEIRKGAPTFGIEFVDAQNVAFLGDRRR